MSAITTPNSLSSNNSHGELQSRVDRASRVARTLTDDLSAERAAHDATKKKLAAVEKELDAQREKTRAARNRYDDLRYTRSALLDSLDALAREEEYRKRDEKAREEEPFVADGTQYIDLHGFGHAHIEVHNGNFSISTRSPPRSPSKKRERADGNGGGNGSGNKRSSTFAPTPANSPAQSPHTPATTAAKKRLF